MSTSVSTIHLNPASPAPARRGVAEHRRRWGIGLGAFVMLHSLIWLGLIWAGVVSTEESSVAENVQAIALLIAAAVFGGAAARRLLGQRRYRVADALLFIALGLLCLTGALREVPVEKIDVLRPIAAVASGDGRDILMLSLWGALGVMALINIRLLISQRVRNRSRVWLRTRVGMTIVAAMGLLVIAQVLDINISVAKLPRKMLEEAIEVTGCVLLMAGAVLALWKTTDRA